MDTIKKQRLCKISISTPYFAYLPKICKTYVILAAYYVRSCHIICLFTIGTGYLAALATIAHTK
jgi:hypothetical protein